MKPGQLTGPIVKERLRFGPHIPYLSPMLRTIAKILVEPLLASLRRTLFVTLRESRRSTGKLADKTTSRYETANTSTPHHLNRLSAESIGLHLVQLRPSWKTESEGKSFPE
jgi:hypothetical protein